MSESTDHYQSYLLRLWKTDDPGEAGWRASLEDANSGEMEGFSDLQGLFESLRARTQMKQHDDENHD